MAASDGTQQEIHAPAAECCQKHRNVPPIALEHEVYMHVGNQHHVKIDPRVDFTRHSKGAHRRVMAGWDLTRQ